MKRIFVSLILAVAFTFSNAYAQSLKLTLPNKDNSVRFLVIGDTGTGTEKQQELANVMLRYRQVFRLSLYS
jgi:hypothetical protein